MLIIRSSVLAAVFMLMIFFLPVCSIAGQQSNGYNTADGIEGSITDTIGSLDGLIAWWKANSGMEMGDYEI